MIKSKVLNVAIIGQGRSGRNIHAMSLMKWPEKYRIAAVVDGDEMRRNRAVAELGCEAYAAHEQLFERDDIDLIVNATPSHLHVPLSLDFLRHGFHVLCEKPLASSVEEVDQLIAAAGQTGKVLSVFQQARYSPSFVKVKEVIDSGLLGKIVKIRIAVGSFSRRSDWQTLKKYNGGELMNTGPHPIDQALQLFGTDTMPEVICQLELANAFGDAEDYVHLILRGHERPTVDVEISRCNPYPTWNYHVQGTNGGLMGTNSRLQWKYFKPEEAPQQEVKEESPPLGAEGGAAPPKDRLKWYEESDELAQADAEPFYDMLYNVLANGAPLEVTPQQIRQQIAVMNECFRQNPRFAR
jgi:predicted dehydrogenase